MGYRLGNRAALEWVVDQYRVHTDARSGITSDPNLWCEEHDDPEYIVRLVKQVVTVSLETVKIVEGLPAEFSSAGGPGEGAGAASGLGGDGEGETRGCASQRPSGVGVDGGEQGREAAGAPHPRLGTRPLVLRSEPPPDPRLPM